LVAGKVMVRRRLYRGKFDTPKSGKPREVPLSEDARPRSSGTGTSSVVAATS